MEVSASARFDYAGRSLEVGDTFDCEPNDIKLLSDLGWIQVQAKKQAYQTREMRARRK